MMVLYGVASNYLEALIVNIEMRILPLMALKDGDLVERCSSSVRRVLAMLIGDMLGAWIRTFSCSQFSRF
jgi:hypothetical protein